MIFMLMKFSLLLQFVLIVGDSHLRAFVDRFTEMPEGKFFFWYHVDPWGPCCSAAH